MAFSGAVSGPANLAVSVTCRDSPDLYRHLTQRIGAIDAIRQSRLPWPRLLERAGTVMEGTGCPNPLGKRVVRG